MSPQDDEARRLAEQETSFMPSSVSIAAGASFYAPRRPWRFSLDGGSTWIATARRPNRFHRAMQRFVFGITWEENK